MASHPSVLISSIVSFFWVTLLRHDTFSKVYMFALQSLDESYVSSILLIYEHLERSIGPYRPIFRPTPSGAVLWTFRKELQ